MLRERSFRKLLLSLSILIVLFLSSSRARAVLPDQELMNRVSASPVKAVVEVEEVKTMPNKDYNFCDSNEAIVVVKKLFNLSNENLNGSPDKVVSNESAKSVVTKTPEIGTKLKVNFLSAKPEQAKNAPPGSWLFLEVKKGDKALVTIDEMGGLTSYTLMTPEMEKALATEPAGLEAGPSNIHLKKN
ncbi:MAG: hypothetical protein HQM08_24035 [Candidatus Riflebacteria bacterium]|nr:hypothetical protein [Candidatus Riflebacteria bacterium]